MSNVVKLSTAANSYIRARRSGRSYAVEIVTPVSGMKPLVTTVAKFSDIDAASSHAEEAGRQMHRPVHLPKGGAP